MKIYRTFVVTSIRNGRTGCLQDVAGIFYVRPSLVRYGSVTPCGALMRPLPFRWKSKGSAEPFFISAPRQTFLTGMTSPDEKCLHGIHVSHPNRCTHETGKSIYSPSPYCFRPEPAGCQAANDAYAFIVYYGLLDRYHSFLSHRHALPWKSHRFRHLLLKNNRQAIRLLLDVFLEEDFPVPGTSPPAAELCIGKPESEEIMETSRRNILEQLQGNTLVELIDEKSGDNGFFCMALVGFLTREIRSNSVFCEENPFPFIYGKNSAEFWHDRFMQAKAGHCPYRKRCIRYKNADTK